MFQPTKQVVAFEHVRTVVPFAVRVILPIPSADTIDAFAENNALVPLTVAPAAGAVMLTDGFTE